MSLIKYYCPDCKNIEIGEVDLEKTIWNPRDMYGHPLLHFPCPKCGSLNNASMIELWTKNIDKQDEGLDDYIISVIEMYGIEDYGIKWREFLKVLKEQQEKQERRNV